MTATAKVFTTGNSQAIRLPKAFRVQATEVWISKFSDGTLTIWPKHEDERKKNLDKLFRLIQEQPITEEFIPPRDDEYRPSPFEDEVTSASVCSLAAKSAKLAKNIPKLKIEDWMALKA